MSWPRCRRQDLIGDFELTEARSAWVPASGRRHLIPVQGCACGFGSCKKDTSPEMGEARGWTCFGCVSASGLVLLCEYEADK